jgi:hypothetical protein
MDSGIASDPLPRPLPEGEGERLSNCILCRSGATLMEMLGYRLLLLISFVAYMAAIYVALHIVVAHFSKTPGSRLLWFFSVLTRPLTRPIRAVLPEGMPESQVRYLTLVACVVIWLATRLLLAGLRGVQRGG